MLKICVFTLIVAAVVSFPSVDNNDTNYRLYTGQKRFSASLLNSFRKNYPAKNLFFSPHSTYRALLIAYFGAEGETKKSLEEALFLTWANDKSAIAEAYKNEALARVKRAYGDGIQFDSVDKLYVTKDAQLK